MRSTRNPDARGLELHPGWDRYFRDRLAQGARYGNTWEGVGSIPVETLLGAAQLQSQGDGLGDRRGISRCRSC